MGNYKFVFSLRDGDSEKPVTVHADDLPDAIMKAEKIAKSRLADPTEGGLLGAVTVTPNPERKQQW